MIRISSNDTVVRFLLKLEIEIRGTVNRRNIEYLSDCVRELQNYKEFIRSFRFLDKRENTIGKIGEIYFDDF